MRCAACRRKVVFGSVTGEAWKHLTAGDWLLGGRPPATGKLGDCPQCGLTLEWEPGEEALQDPHRPAPPRVHLSALREGAPKFDDREIWMRALVLEHDGVLFLSDSWRNRGKDAVESDGAMIERLSREQTPRIDASFSTAEARDRFHESARALDAGPAAWAAWIEAEGLFRAKVPNGGSLAIRAISSIWPPRD